MCLMPSYTNSISSHVLVMHIRMKSVKREPGNICRHDLSILWQLMPSPGDPIPKPSHHASVSVLPRAGLKKIGITQSFSICQAFSPTDKSQTLHVLGTPRLYPYLSYVYRHLWLLWGNRGAQYLKICAPLLSRALLVCIVHLISKNIFVIFVSWLFSVIKT